MTIQEDFQTAFKAARLSMQKLSDMAEKLNIRQEYINEGIQFLPTPQEIDDLRAALTDAIATDVAMIKIAGNPELQVVAPAASSMRAEDFTRYERQIQRLERLTPRA